MSNSEIPTSKEEWIVTDDGHDIFTKTWFPVGKPVASVVLVHGFGEHVNRYNHVSEEFTKAGIQVTSFDQRGFGESGKKSKTLGSTGGYAKAMPDITAALQRAEIEGAPLFLMGHSYGGGQVLNYDCIGPLRSKLAGVIASAPLILLTPPQRPFNITVSFAGAVSKILPSFQIPTSISAKILSRDPKEVEKYETDSLVHGYGTTKGMYDMLSNGKALLTTRYKDFSPDIPLLICHGSGDKLTDHTASKALFEKVQVKDKELKIYGGYFHELHNEPEADRKIVIDYYIAWILKHVPGAPAAPSAPSA
ncbi:hypothetical protein BGZ49_007485 [Haplosporangium sp. Z 27]|nr:hypothetical protein BGZ49_007485 [Haplosporangium sp. Z 27]